MLDNIDDGIIYNNLFLYSIMSKKIGTKFNFYFPLLMKKLKRGPQVILPKDLGVIVALSGMNKDSIVIDAGTGSGYAAIFFASIAKKVITYEKVPEFAAFARKNIARSGLDNIIVREKDIFKGVREKADIIHLDLPGAEKIFKSRFSLREDGCVVSYLPNIEQVVKFVKTAVKKGFETFTVEVMLREIMVRETGTRPQTKGLMHTGYLTFARKMKKI
ncbi:MAG: methyltransferase domain-containing protein [Candidatus Bathyarchaeia archaeon]